MDSMEYVERLRYLSSEKYKKNIVKLGIPEKDSIGVSVGEIRKLAKGVKKDNKCAYELWKTGYHEAKMLAILLFDKKEMDFIKVDRLMDDVISWDLCDFLCNNLIIKLEDSDEFVSNWVSSYHLYRKRAAFSIIAMSAVHKKDLNGEDVKRYFQYILDYSNDERLHIKKAVSWALREIGKINYLYNEKAILVSYELLEKETRAQKWIGKDALKELENLVKVDERGRLLTRNSKMGKLVI